jgi:tellurite resistance protein TerC
VLVFIGLKMLLEHYISKILEKTTQVSISLMVIVCCIVGSIIFSIYVKKKGTPKDALIE